MSSLPWICAVTLALLCCLTAQPLKPNSLLIEIKNFSDTVENDTCWKDIVNPTFYAPVDVKKDCVHSALDCYIKEFHVLVEECQSESEQNIEDAADDLMTQLEDLKKSDTSCTDFACEVFPQKPFKEFLNNMKTLLQQITALSNPV
ncbi:interleukin-21-like isoform X2 [Triplophysa rosa]|uniref:interleukin-21-like isoform X2 n=1 Tax=Triplophysa rosa TaxID=992332 RepID=UPI0025460092|nr:interleukin-21-like isoform X2 [Triplophysa rosa]